jgi:hypothetical protein
VAVEGKRQRPEPGGERCSQRDEKDGKRFHAHVPAWD